MSNTEERESEAAEELESEMEERQEARLDAEDRLTKNLNQGYDDPVDAKHPGINWGPSYRIRRKQPSKRAKDQKESSNSNG